MNMHNGYRYVISLLGLLLYVILAFGSVNDSGSSSDSHPSSPSESRTTAYAPPITDSSPMPAHEVLDRDTYDSPIKTQIVIHAVVSGNIRESGLRQLLQKLYDETRTTRGFKYNGGRPTHIFIYLYTSHAHFKSGMGQWIAMLSKVGDDSQLDINVKTELISQLTAEPEVKHGLLEYKRKEIFKAIVTAEDRADEDAQRMHPIPDPLKPGYSREKVGTQWKNQIEAFISLEKKYKTEVANRYGITEEQLLDISLEGIEMNWPMP